MKVMTLTLLFAASGAAAGPVEAARGAKILAEARAACGGSAWDRVTGWHEHGRVSMAGRPDAAYDGWSAMTRAAMAVRTNAFAGGYDAGTYWETAPGGITTGSVPARVRSALRDAYVSNFGWLQPERFPAAVEAIGARTIGASDYDVVRVVPVAADPVEIWFDRTNHRAARIVAGGQTIDLRDYTIIAGVCAASTAIQTSVADGKTTTVHIDAFETAAVPTATFAPPR